ncbi:MAG: hypothetical protein NUV51_00630 [Sulfuricaulis sp.]|nr:hypothetical protein [Sulfuricaulis sp.]
MQVFSKLSLLFSAILTISGCATGVSYQEFKTGKAPIKTIAILSVSNPVKYQIMNYGSPTVAFGAIGGAVAGAKAASATEKFNEAIKTTHFDFSKEMMTRLTRYLREQGYNVVAVGVKRESPLKLIEDYSKVSTAGADAILDVGIRSVGYATVNMMDRDFWPHVQMDLRLVSAGSKSVIYSEQVLFGYHNPFMSATELPADKQYYFQDFDALMTEKEKAMHGLKEGANSVARHVASRLKL